MVCPVCIATALVSQVSGRGAVCKTNFNACAPTHPAACDPLSPRFSRPTNGSRNAVLPLGGEKERQELHNVPGAACPH